MKRYWPLFTLLLVAALGALALQYGTHGSFVYFFMGLFFCQFSMLKLFNLSGFADGFQKYDLVGKRFRIYAYLYPFIELTLGLSYLSAMNLVETNIATVVFMGIGAIGVIRALRAGLDVRCACMGTVLDVPLSTVTLSEDLAMGLMALFMLL